MLILHCELVIWSIVRTGLIQNDFMSVKTGLESIIKFASEYNFVQHYNQLVQNIILLVEEKEFEQMSKKMVKKIPTHYQTY